VDGVTKQQENAVEAIGFILILFGVALWVHAPWLLIIIGALCVYSGNTGRAGNGSS
jgi:1,4-dihydroxy-2-naphthoate octaprenyltransferase